MKKISYSLIVGLMCWCLAAQAQQVGPRLQAIMTYQYGQSREPLTVVEDMVKVTIQFPAQRKILAAQLAALLGSEATKDCKLFVCRQLALIGGPENVPAIAPLLLNADTNDMARYALEPIPGKAVDQALLNALEKVDGPLKVGILNVLGQRKCEAAVDDVAKLTTDADPQIAEAAINTLGVIGGTQAIAKLAAAQDKVDAKLKGKVYDARLLCAQHLMVAGKTRKAGRLFQAINDKGAPARIRRAAFVGEVRCAGNRKAARLIDEGLKSDDAAVKKAATGLEAQREMMSKHK